MPTFDELYKYHSFSKAPAASGLTTGQSVNKAGHTITAKDVWAFDIPYMFSVNTLSDLGSKNPKLNDLAWAGADEKYYQYNGTSWDDITDTISDTKLRNADGEEVLRFHKGKLTVLDNSNNAGVTSNGQAYRYFIGDKPVQRWVAATDCIDETGFPSLGYNIIVVKNGNSTLLDGTDFFADYYGATIFFDTEELTQAEKDELSSAEFNIACFEYIGNYVSEELGGVGTFYDARLGKVTKDDLWGRSVTTYEQDKSVVIDHRLLSSMAVTDEWRSKVTNVYDNRVYDSNNSFAFNLEVDKLGHGFETFKDSSIENFKGSLDNLYSGEGMFKNSTISNFNSNLPKLIYAPEMFKGTNIATFNRELPSLTYAKSMFEDTDKLNEFTGNTGYLLIAENMFNNSAIKSFSGSLPYLYVGTNMFKNTNLNVINTKLSALVTGVGMFENTMLSLDSLENIAKSLPRLNYLIATEDGNTAYHLENGITYYYIKYAYNEEHKLIIGEYVPYEIPGDIIGEITISWKYPENLEYEGTIIAIRDYFRWMQLNGWTVITNITDSLEEESTTKIWARVYNVSSEEEATHKTSDNQYVKLSTATNVYLPVNMFTKEDKYTWKQYNSEAEAITSLGLQTL